jgi:hypothetical protein
MLFICHIVVEQDRSLILFVSRLAPRCDHTFPQGFCSGEFASSILIVYGRLPPKVGRHPATAISGRSKLFLETLSLVCGNAASFERESAYRSRAAARVAAASRTKKNPSFRLSAEPLAHAAD